MRLSRHRFRVLFAAVALIAPLLVVAPPSSGSGQRPTERFVPVGTFDIIEGNGSAVAEIIDVSDDGSQLVYTDADNEQIGFVNIGRLDRPRGTGVLDVGGEPTSLAIDGRYILVAVNTSESFTNPSGELLVIARGSRQILARHDLGGQPDSIDISDNGRLIAVVIENERDEDLGGGLLPQLPTGGLVIVDAIGDPQDWTLRAADFSPLMSAAADGSDLEPEYVDINRRNHAVVSFQENNHLAVVDLATGATLADFPAGSVTLHNVDTDDNNLIEPTETITRRREPDSVAWLDDDRFATANEGDYEDADGVEGGSRGFTIFNVDGSVEYESAEAFEHWLMSAGHYLDGRSDAKGVEPEAITYARVGGMQLLFVGAERANAVGVYNVSTGEPKPLQILATGLRPEGITVVPKRKLVAVSSESDEAGDGIPTMITLYQLTQTRTPYPQLTSAFGPDGAPIPWVALSGLAGDPVDADTIYAVSDSFLDAGFIYTIDVSGAPTIVGRTEISGSAAELDPEGVAVGPDGTFWVGSEGNASDRPNLVLQVDDLTGAVLAEIELPADLVDERRGNGIEGIAVTGEPGAEVVYVAIQRAWPDEGDIDEVNTKIGRYDTATGTWGFVHYPLEAEGVGDWIGLSELTLLPDGSFAVIERDKGWGPSTGPIAELKAVYGVDLAEAEFRAFDDPAGLVTIDKRLLRDLLPDLEATSVWTTEKVEGLAVSADDQVYVVTDNDGVDDATGETIFLDLGRWTRALRG